MQRSDFGWWGSDLDPDQFASALAALGVLFGAGHPFPFRPPPHLEDALRTALTGSAPARWSWPGDPSEFVPPTPARLLADAWQAVVASSAAPRLLVAPGTPRPDAWLLAQLARPSVKASAVSFELEPGDAGAEWSWPLRVGFLGPDGGLRERLADPHASLHELVELTRPGSPVDLLVFRGDLRGALRAALEDPDWLAADVVLLLGGLGVEDEQVDPLVGALRSEIDSEGVVALDSPPADHAERIWGFVAELAHNLPVDEAVFRAARSPGGGLPVVFASPGLLEVARLATSLAAMAEALSAGGAQQVDLEPDVLAPLGLPQGASAAEVGSALGARAKNYGYRHEHDEALQTARLRRAAAQHLGPSTRPPRAMAAAPTAAAVAPEPVRKLGVRIFAAAEAAAALQAEVRLQAGEPLRPGEPHVLQVSIGPEDDPTWVPAAEPFPDSSLPRSRRGHMLTVVFHEAPRREDVVPEPQVGRIHLPRTGRSRIVSFPFRTAAEATRFEARVTVLYRNRVLQSARISAPVAGSADERPFAFELLDYDTADAAADAPPSDAALVFNHTERGIATVIAAAGKKVKLAPISDLASLLATLDANLSESTKIVRTGGKGLTPKQLAKALRSVAIHGWLVWDKFASRIPDAVRRARRIQVTEAMEHALLPVELFYRFPGPLPEATLCPQATGALQGRKCSGCPEGDAREKVVCPVQFWGLQAVIERRAHPEPGRQAEPSTVPLRASSGALIALAKDVAKQAAPVGQLMTSLAGLVRGPARIRRVKDSEEWKTAVQDLSPALLVLVVHKASDAGTDALEFGGVLGVGNLRESHVRGPTSRTGPIVLLVGCSTARASRVSFEAFPPYFLARRASAVLATLATVRARYAAPATARILDELAAATRRGHASFADVLLDVRRSLVLAGEPIGLSLVSYGDSTLVA